MLVFGDARFRNTEATERFLKNDEELFPDLAGFLWCIFRICADRLVARTGDGSKRCGTANKDFTMILMKI